MGIYTRTGDGGTTSLGDGTRVPKVSARVEAYGTIDEANSFVGLARASVTDERLSEILRFIQQRLFNCAGSLAAPDSPTGNGRGITPADLEALEHAVDAFTDAVGPLDSFVIPGGSESAARLQVARAVVRRAERRAAGLAETEPVDPLVLGFLNRASDALFAATRYAAHLDGVGEEPWDPAAEAPQL